MLGWRKRNDGFEWREYVRTTILVRRKQRRDRIGEAGRAVVENLKVAGQRGAVAGAEGAKAVGRGAVHLGQQGAAMGAAGAKVVGEGMLHYGKEGAVRGAVGARAAGARVLHFGRQGAKLGVAGAKVGLQKFRAAMPVAGSYLQRLGAALFYALAYALAVLRTLCGLAADYLGPSLAPIGAFLRRPGIRVAALTAGVVALLGGVIRANANGFESDTVIALSIGIGLLGALAAAHASSRMPSWVASLWAPVAMLADRLRSGIETAAGSPIVQKGFAAVVIVAVLAGTIHAFWPASRMGAARHSRQETRQAMESGDVEGRGTAISGDTLRVGATTVRLNGIEAPLRNQVCTGAGEQEWDCGDAARLALARMLRSGRVVCDISSGSADGNSTGNCRVDGHDVAAELVRGGHVFASSGIFASYSGLEREARANKAGIWSGGTVRPSEYRDRKWEEAKRTAPDGCPIKGSIRGGRRFYIVPWARGYEQARVAESRGERWFCSEAEAQEAGFKPAEQS